MQQFAPFLFENENLNHNSLVFVFLNSILNFVLTYSLCPLISHMKWGLIGKESPPDGRSIINKQVLGDSLETFTPEEGIEALII
jgi:hypothetical protein